MNELKVIGAGFGRTGTDSMRAALEMLGVGPCHHMRALIDNPAHRQDWKNCIESGAMNWDLLLDGYQSSVDWPTAYYWPELTQRFPNAKVLLTWRSADSWWESMTKTIIPVIKQARAKGTRTPGSLILEDGVLKGKPMDREHCVAAYEANVTAVKEQVPAERLLIHKLGDGWGPLCEFLQVPVPSTAYPRSNNSEEFHELLSKGND